MHDAEVANGQWLQQGGLGVTEVVDASADISPQGIMEFFHPIWRHLGSMTNCRPHGRVARTTWWSDMLLNSNVLLWITRIALVTSLGLMIIRHDAAVGLDLRGDVLQCRGRRVVDQGRVAGCTI
ncbi:hypothetical protein CONLIGDRAFT_687714 [Coniochaeta ligniaria NRRL 30616]|uniref:Uncharacterized protein n=1 Tax=Coniochaeta ligniaria NRRL 30616 TaxID=1408157 RepID=A0A1J7IXF2_9PEZI|nr:hypothetical protein CONLIGDRAFT_687714 [Coniochaeta ligniaria NRRL 30616]